MLLSPLPGFPSEPSRPCAEDHATRYHNQDKRNTLRRAGRPYLEQIYNSETETDNTNLTRCLHHSCRRPRRILRRPNP